MTTGSTAAAQRLRLLSIVGLGVAACVTLPLSLPTTAHARARVGGVPDTWCQPLQVFSQPPAGFNPLRATASQLKRYGFPPRPPQGDAGALAAWTKAVSSAKFYRPPHPICGTSSHAIAYNGH